MKAAAWIDPCSSHVIPEAQLGQGDAESIGDGDQRIAPARGVENHVGRWRGDGGDGNDESFEALQAVAGVQLVGVGELRLGNAKFAGDGGQGVLGGDAMVAPGAAPGLGDQANALVEKSAATGGQVKVKGCVWSGHPQQAGVEGGQLIDRGFDNV